MSSLLISSDGHSKGFGGAVYVGADPCVVVSGGDDGRLCLREADDPNHQLQEVNKADASSVNCIAAHPHRKQYAIGDKRTGVYVYEHPEGRGVLVGRLQLPVLALAFDCTGNKLAAAGDETGIQILLLKNVAEGLKAQVLRKLDAEPHTRSIAWDPEGDFITALSAAGTLQIWSAETAEQVASKSNRAPNIMSKGLVRSTVAWNPYGDHLAAPGNSNDVVFYERQTWKTAFKLEGEHTGPVRLLAYSPNGQYMATAGQDCKLVVWDLEKKAKIAEQDTKIPLVSVDWRPEGNSILCMSSDGKVLMWKEPVPSSLLAPCIEVEREVSQSRRSRGSSPFHDSRAGDEAEEPDGAGNRYSGFDDIIGRDGDRYDDGPEKEAASSQLDHPAASNRHYLASRRQPAFQPGESATGKGRQRWLAHNLRGCIKVTEEDEMNIMDVAFHDRIANNLRVLPYRDYQSLELASLGEKGALYAKRGDEEQEGCILWRPFQSAFQNSEWTLPLAGGERVEAIAAGRNFVAAATSLPHLRIFTTAGLQISVNSLAGPPVALAAQGDSLAVVWHSSPSPVLGDQSLHFAVYDVSFRVQLHAGPLPLSAGSTLAWLGFTEEGLLSTFDTEEVLRVWSTDFGGCWQPVFSSESVADNEQEGAFWPVGVNSTHLVCVPCNGADGEPLVQRLVHKTYDLKPLVLGGDQVTTGYEAEWLLASLQLSHLQSQLDEAQNAGKDTEEMENELIGQQTKADRALLRLFQDALKTGRYQRANGFASNMHLQRSLEGALKLTNHHKVPILAESIGRILASKLEQASSKEPEPVVTPVPAPAFTPASGKAALDDASPRVAVGAVTEASGNDLDDEMDYAGAGSETKPASRAYGSGSSLIQGNPLSRKPSHPQALKPKNTSFSGGQTDSGKRKAASSNPFMRRSKVAK